MRDNIANVFGPRTVEALMPIEAPLGDLAHASGYVRSRKLAASDSVRSRAERGIKEELSCVIWLHCCRYISKGSASFGKSGGDKQYFFINGRPMNLPKVRASKPMGAGLHVSSNFIWGPASNEAEHGK